MVTLYYGCLISSTVRVGCVIVTTLIGRKILKTNTALPQNHLQHPSQSQPKTLPVQGDLVRQRSNNCPKMWSFVLFFFEWGFLNWVAMLPYSSNSGLSPKFVFCCPIRRVLVEQSTMVDLKAFVTANQRNKINPEQEAVSFQCHAVYNIE